MAQLLGEFEVPVDSKGRIFVPAEIRRKLPPEASESMVIIHGFDHCLLAYPLDVWDETAEKMRALRQTDPEARMVIRTMLSQATEARIDRQGRAAIPRRLLDRVGIKDQLVVIGALDKLELWEPAQLSSVMSSADESLQETARKFDL
jgi:MraZ protein